MESAQDTLDTLKEEQTALLALENGVVTADEDGTIAAVPYEAEDTLQSGTAFALYCDTQTIMISVEVPQENIAQVGVGDEVSVMIAGNRDGAVTGTVSSIASSAHSRESRRKKQNEKEKSDSSSFIGRSSTSFDRRDQRICTSDFGQRRIRNGL